jgi:hypothetical protein
LATISAAEHALGQQQPQKIDQKAAQYQTSPKNGQALSQMRPI